MIKRTDAHDKVESGKSYLVFFSTGWLGELKVSCFFFSNSKHFKELSYAVLGNFSTDHLVIELMQMRP